MISLEDYCITIKKPLIIMQRLQPAVSPFTWYARIKGAEIKQGVVLVSHTGNGDSPQEALREYARYISGKTLVFNAMSEDRQEFDVPELL